MFNVTIKTNNGDIIKPYNDKILISDILSDCGLYIDMPCGKKGTCLKCKIKVSGGIETLKPLNNDYVLACQTYAVNDCIIYFSTKTDNLQVVNSRDVDLKINPLVKSGCGMAVDIGTTTIHINFFSLSDGQKLDEICVRNEQRQFGSDVISRIEHAIGGGLPELTATVRHQIDEIMTNFHSQIDASVICGNTTMMHLYTGLDPSDMGHYPFIVNELFGKYIDNNVYIPDCISAFLGADINCAIIASEMTEKNETSLLVDIGTNGEIALFDNGSLSCTSTAAGPAFEGALIHMGMLSVSGAISKVFAEGNQIKFETISNQKELGICGSGLIDAISVFLQFGLIDETGAIVEETSEYITEYDKAPALKLGDVIITGKDVRQVQLAKSAICSGIETLLQENRISDVDRFYIAGGFGSYLNLENAAKIGLIPQKFVDKTVILGNAALTGAGMILLNKDHVSKSEEIKNTAKIVNLESSNYFMDKYIENMMFE